METYTKWQANQKYFAGNEEQKVFNYNQAIQLYSDAIELNFEEPQYYGERGISRFNLLEFNLALQDAQQAILLDESYIDGYLLAIRCSIALGKKEHINSISVELCLKLSNFQGDITTAAEAIVRLTELGVTAQVYLAPEQDELNKLKQLIDDYNNFFDEKDYNSCLSVMAEAIKICPGALNFQLRRAECMLWKKCVTEAMYIAQRVIKLDSSSAKAHYMLGLIYFHRDMPDEALISLKCSLQNDQEYKKAKTLRVLIKQVLAYKTQANILFKAGHYTEALEAYLNILELNIKDNNEVTSKMWYNCALMNSKLRNFEEAITNCNAALQRNPKYYKAFWKRAQCHFYLEGYDNCLRDCIAAYNIEISSEVVDLFNEALKHSSNSLVNDHDADEAFKVWNELYQSGLYNEAIEVCSEAISFSPMNIKFYDHRIECAIKSGNYQMALKDLATLTLIDDNNESRKLLKLKCSIFNGDLDEANDIIQTVSIADNPYEDEYIILVKKLRTAFKVSEHFENENYNTCLIFLATLGKAIEMKPLSSSYKLIEAECLYNTCYYEESMVILNEVLQSDPLNAKAYYLKGLICYNTLELNKSIEHFSQCLEYNSEIVEAQIMLQKSIEVKVKINLDDRIREDETLKINEGLKYLDTSNYKKACDCFTEAIKVNSNNSQTYAYRAECNMHLKLYELAIDDVECSTKIDPSSSEGYLLTAKCYLIIGDIFRADVTLQRLQKLSIVDPVIEAIMKDFRALMASVKCATKSFNSMNYRKCIEEIESALEIAHASVHFRMIKAECLVWLAEYDDAQCIMKSLPPSNDNEYINGLISYMKNNLQNASQLLDRCNENDPGHKNAKRLLSNLKSFMMRIDRGNELMEMGKFEDAINIFTEAMVVDKKNVVVNSELHLRCAECNYKLGYLKECLNECNFALNLVPRFQEATKLQDQCKTDIAKIENERKFANEAAMHIRNGDDFRNKASWERAIASYTTAIDLKPDQASYYAKRAECLFLFGNFESSLADARKTTELDETSISGYIWEAKCSITLGETGNQKKIVEKLEQIETKFTLNNDEKKEIIEVKAICTLFLNATSSLEKKEYLQAIQHIDSAFLNFPNCIPSHYKIMKTECLIRLSRLNEASQNIQQLEYTKSHHLLFLKGLWYYFDDNFRNAVEYFNSYMHHKEYQKNDEVEILLKVSEIIQGVMKPSFFSYNLLKTLNTEIAKYASQEDIISKEICVNLYYQRALVNEKLGKNDDAIMDCFNALCMNKSYVNALKLRQYLLKLEGRYYDSILDCETLLAIEENEDTRREYEKLKKVCNSKASAFPEA